MKKRYTKSRLTAKSSIFAFTALLSVNFGYVTATYSCACCGQDNSWSTNTLNSKSYEAKLVRGVIFTKGTFDNHDMHITVDTVVVKNGKYYFKTKQGNFAFEPKKTFDHRKIDITFITNKKYKLDNVADIYHSLIFSGTLSYPKKLSKQFKVKNVRARLIFQGLGNACIDVKNLTKWIIKPIDPGKGYFQASGRLKTGQ